MSSRTNCPAKSGVHPGERDHRYDLLPNKADGAVALREHKPQPAGQLPGAGDVAPDFTSHGLDGAPVSLRQWHGRAKRDNLFLTTVTQTETP